MVSTIKNLPYNERLIILKLPSLYYRHKRGDMVLVYQIHHRLIDINLSIFFTPATISTTSVSLHEDTMFPDSRLRRLYPILIDIQL